MLRQENFSEEHIRKLQKNSRRDPVLIERAVYAFGLLEALARVGMPFIFKGGTCLMLLLDHPQRLSTDIDIIVEPEYLKVILPSANCILADKLTAFAPHTTGIPLNIGKDMEVMKQFYDVSSLLDVFTDYKQIGPTYERIAKAEIEYRGIDNSVADCLWDTFDTALCIASRGKINKEEYSLYVKGIRNLRGHIYAEDYSPEIAAVRATKVMYMAICLLTNTEFETVEDFNECINKKITQSKVMSLQYMRKASLEAYAYVVKTDEILSEMNK